MISLSIFLKRSEKMKRGKRTKKKPVYEPFEDSSTLDFFDEDFRCTERYPNSVTELNLEELVVAQEMIEDAINDYETIIDIQLKDAKNAFLRGESYDTSSLKTDRQRKEQLKVELRTVKEQIEMMTNNNVKEYAIA